MKICFLAASNSIHSHKWINYFADQGHKVIWISLVPATSNISNNIFVDLEKKQPLNLFS